MYTVLVYTNIVMKNITFSADEHLIEQARDRARSQHTTLNEAFREWLVRYTSKPSSAKEISALMKRLKYVDVGRHFSRDELNER